MLNLLLVSLPVLLEQVVCLGLSRGIGIGIVQQVLDAKENLFDGDCWLPTLLFVKDRKAYGAGWVDIGMEKRRYEFACEL